MIELERPSPAVAVRRAVELLEQVIDADIDDGLHVIDGDEEVSAFQILEDLRAVMPVTDTEGEAA